MSRLQSKNSNARITAQSGNVPISADYGMEGQDYFLPFTFNVTTVKNTAIASYLTTSLTVPVGRITGLWVEFPRGSTGLAGFQLWRGSTQIFPRPAGSWMTGNDFLIHLAFTHIIASHPLQIDMRTYNLDDSYSHRIMVILEMSGNNSNVPVIPQSFIEALKKG